MTMNWENVVVFSGYRYNGFLFPYILTVLKNTLRYTRDFVLKGFVKSEFHRITVCLRKAIIFRQVRQGSTSLIMDLI